MYTNKKPPTPPSEAELLHHPVSSRGVEAQEKCMNTFISNAVFSQMRISAFLTITNSLSNSIKTGKKTNNTRNIRTTKIYKMFSSLQRRQADDANDL